MSKVSTDGAVYRLRGRLGGSEQLFDLGVGEHLAGSSRTCALILPDPSVSRRHARLIVTPGSLIAEDLASTNGTRVDGRRIVREAVPAGAELALGDVRLTVETVDRDDSALALTFGAPGDRAAALAGSALERSTLILPPAGAGGEWLDRVAGFVRRLPREPWGGLASALAGLGESLGAAGAAAVHWSGREGAVVLAGWGTVGALPAAADLARQPGHPAAGESASVLFVPGDSPSGEPPLALAFERERGRPEEIGGLAIWGEFPGRTSSARFLAALLACLSRFAPWSEVAAGEAPATAGELAFPAGYRRGTSRPMAALYEQMRHLVTGDLPVLIHGETGVGKELVARALHDSSPRRGGPFVAINCAAIPRDLLEAQLFGVERGVATGVEPRPGRFEQARGGTLFLDEIGEMAPELQAKLLRALQEKEIQPLGGRPKRIDLRVISATHADLARPGEVGGLRPDLFYRLAGYLLEVPPLRRCPEDLPGLVEHFLARFARESGRPVRGVTVAALRLLTGHAWPGNVRELENEVRHLAYAAPDDGIVRQSALSARLRQPADDPAGGLARLAAALPSLALEPAVRATEAAVIAEALSRAGGSRSAAARLLGLSRNGLYKKMKQLGLDGGGNEEAESEDPGQGDP